MTQKKSAKKKQRKVKLVKAPTPDKVKLPSTKELRLLYEGMVTADEGHLVAALVSAIHWYEKAMDWVLYKMEGHPSTQQSTDRGQFRILWARGVASKTNVEKIEAYQQALHYGERILRTLKVKVPPIKDVVSAIEAQQQRLVDYEAKLRQKFDYILTVLEEALQPMNSEGTWIKLKVGKIKDPMIMDPQLTTLSFRKDQVKAMNLMMRKEGIWPVVLQVSEPLARMASMEPGSVAGKREVNHRMMVAKLFALWRVFQTWAQKPGAPKRLIKQDIPKPKVQRKPPQHVPGFHGKRDKVMGMYLKTSAMGRLLETLQDGQFHSEDDLQKLIYPTKLQSRLPWLDRHGRESGYWTMERVGGEVRLQVKGEANATGT